MPPLQRVSGGRWRTDKAGFGQFGEIEGPVGYETDYVSPEGRRMACAEIDVRLPGTRQISGAYGLRLALTDLQAAGVPALRLAPPEPGHAPPGREAIAAGRPAGQKQGRATADVTSAGTGAFCSCTRHVRRYRQSAVNASGGPLFLPGRQPASKHDLQQSPGVALPPASLRRQSVPGAAPGRPREVIWVRGPAPSVPRQGRRLRRCRPAGLPGERCPGPGR